MQEIFEKIKKIDSQYAHQNIQGRNFNLFNLFNADHDEVSVCWILYDLLDKNGSHGQGDVYFQLFCKTILKGLNLQEQEITHKETKVHRNYRTTKNRYIDLAIETPMRFIPIEVKIYAPDQNKQCKDYYDEAKRITEEKNKEMQDDSIPSIKICYLTLDGKEPTSESRQGLSDEDIQRISFRQELYQWLEKCLTKSCTHNADFVRVNIIQFMDAIERWPNSMVAKKSQDILDVISDQEERQYVLKLVAAFSCKEKKLFADFINKIQNVINLNNEHIRENDSYGFEFWYKENFVDDYTISFYIYKCSKGTFMGYRLWKNKEIFVSLKGEDSRLNKEDREAILNALPRTLPKEVDWKPDKIDGEWGWITCEPIPEFNQKRIDFYVPKDETLTLVFDDVLDEYFNKGVKPRLQKLLPELVK